MIARSVFLAATLLLAAAAGARADDFYANHMQRGLANYQKGNFAQAAADFRIAAFGLIDSSTDYETALIFGALANWKLQRTEDARQIAQKIVHVERIAPVYAKLPIAPELRAELEAMLPKVVRADQLARAPAFAHLASQSTAPAPQPATQPVSGAQAMSLLQSGNENAARAMALNVIADDYTNALAQTVLAILAGRRGDWNGVVEHYSVVRTRRRLNNDEMNTYVIGLVRSGRTADANGVEKTRGMQPFVAKSTAPAPPPTAPPAPTALLAEADRALREGRIIVARDAYRRLAATDLPRDVALSVARGLNQTAAYRDSSAEYQKLYPLHAGEEVHMFYEAVNRYEMGDYAIARKLLARALPALPKTRDVELYRSRIERTQ